MATLTNNLPPLPPGRKRRSTSGPLTPAQQLGMLLVQRWDVTPHTALFHIQQLVTAFHGEMRVAQRRGLSYVIGVYRTHDKCIGLMHDVKGVPPMLYIIDKSTNETFPALSLDPVEIFGAPGTWATVCKVYWSPTLMARAISEVHPTECSGHGCKYCGPYMTRCPGCSITKYCSKQCRETDWIAGHREECASLATTRYIALM